MSALHWLKLLFGGKVDLSPKQGGVCGEVGLMQIRELTAQEWCTDNKIKNFDPSHLFNPQTNILYRLVVFE
jgi:soluble lytic murein transglycosylase-like protein